MSNTIPVGSSLDTFVAAAPWPQRMALRALLSLARARAEWRCSRRLAPLDQLAYGLLTLGAL